MTNNKTTIHDVLMAVNKFSSLMDKRMDKMDGGMGKLEGRMEKLEGTVTGMQSTMTTLVTKDYLDKKLADLRGDLVVLIRKEDHKVTSLIDVLHSRKVINSGEAKSLFRLEPFPRLERA